MKVVGAEVNQLLGLAFMPEASWSFVSLKA
jgi:hypothetical protein